MSVDTRQLEAAWFGKTAIGQVETLENVLSPGKPSEHPEVAQFLKDMERAFKRYFPKGHYTARAEGKFGHAGIYITTHTLPKGQQSNGILQNDPSRNTFWMHDSFDESGMKDRIKIEISEGGSLAVTPAPDSYMAFDMIKVGWRNGTGKPAAIVRKFDQYFAKLARAVKENAHRTPKRVAPLKAGSKTASNNLLWSIVDERAYHKLRRSFGKQNDEATVDMATKVARQLMEKLTLDNNEQGALNRLMQSVQNPNWDIAQHRNNLFKAANLLGISLPHAMFASDGGELSKRWFKNAEAPIRWTGRHIIIDSDRMMSFKEIPKDEYGQVYDAALLTSRNGVRMKKLVDQIVRGNKAAMLRLKTPYEATRFVDQKVMEATGKSKTPDWHTYSMPD